MATFRGMDGSLKVGANTVLQVTRWTLSGPREKLDASVLGSGSKVYVLGQKDWSGTVAVRFDYGDTNGQKALIDQALAANPTPLVLQFLLSSTKYFEGSAYPELGNVSAELGTIVPAEFNLIPSSDLTITWS